ncbi:MULTISPECIES: hypothetical protein [Chitinophagaceae]
MDVGSSIKNISLIQVNHINYSKNEIAFQKDKSIYDILLQPSYTELPKVSVKSEPFITKRNDTISYSVKKFSLDSDITIGDVLKKMPGITIGQNGEISYNGIAINKFYIDGKDLLENRYNIAETVIPHNLVNLVQVYENHQPINLLRGKEDTYRPALNLVLDSSAKNKLIGTSTVKIGTPNPPTNNSALDINTMAFRKEIQFLNSARYDATGQDLMRETTEHTNDKTDTYLKKDLSPLVGIQNIPPVNIEPNRLTFNKSELLNVNFLYSITENQSLRTKAYLLHERSKMDYESMQKVQLGIDSSIQFIENQNIKDEHLEYFINPNYINNGKKIYLDDNLIVQGYKKDYNASLEDHTLYTRKQKLTDNFIKIENNFTIFRNINKNIILKASNKTGYSYLPEKLNINPFLSLSDSIQNINSNLFQPLTQKTFYNISNIGMKLNIGEFLFSLDNGYKVQSNRYLSDIYIDSNNHDIKSDIYTNNKLEWSFFQSYVQNNISYKIKNLSISASVPFYFSQYESTTNGAKDRIRPTTFSPSFDLRLKLASSSALTFNIGKDYAFGAPQTMLPSFFQNYRTLRINSAPLQESKIKNVSLGYSYKEPINGCSAGVTLSALKTTSSIIQNTTYLPSGLVTIEQLPTENNSRELMMMAFFDKYFFNSKTSLKFNFMSNIHKEQIMQNSIINDLKTINSSVRIDLSSKVYSFLEINNSLSINASKSMILATNESIYGLSNKTDFFFSVNKQFQLGYSMNYQDIINRGNHNDIFINDFFLGGMLGASKNKFSIGVSNFLNKKQYIYSQLNGNNLYMGTYQLRPRSLYLKFFFYL